MSGLDIRLAVCPWLNEREYGDLTGSVRVYPPGVKTFQDRLFYKPPDGESLADVLNRVYMNFGVEDYNGVLIVSHDLILQVIYSILVNRKFEEVYEKITIQEGHYWRPFMDAQGGHFGQEVRK
jgi:broad specificity phosphatase PhoE